MRKFVSNRDESVRLFKNPFLEYMSHIHPATPVIVYFPVIGISLYYGLFDRNPLYTLLSFLAGIFIWTFLEYTIHRFAFHYQPKSERGKKIHFLVHGIHHDYPRDSTRLVMPLPVSIPLSVMLYLLFKFLFGDFYLTYFAGLVFGYLAYDSIHYATHHLPMKKGIGKFLKEYHLRHHYNDNTKSFGVSNPLWDYVFKTVPDNPKRK